MIVRHPWLGVAALALIACGDDTKTQDTSASDTTVASDTSNASDTATSEDTTTSEPDSAATTEPDTTVGPDASDTTEADTIADTSEPDVVVEPPSNVYVWSGIFGGTGGDQVHAVGFAPGHDLLVGGEFIQTMTIGGTTLEAGDNITGYVAQLSDSGARRWTKTIGGEEGGNVYGFARASNGNFGVTGTFLGAMSLGGATFNESGLFAATFDPLGHHVWSKPMPSSFAQPTAMAMTANSSLGVAGWFYTSIDYGNGVENAAGQNDVFATRFTSGGTWDFGFRYGGVGREDNVRFGFSDSGVIMGTVFTGSIEVNGQSLTTADSDIMVASFPSGLENPWAKRFGGSGYESIDALTVAPNGNIVLVGSLDGPVDFGGGIVTTDLEYESFVVTLDAQGNHVASAKLGYYLGVSAITVDESGDIFVAGSTCDESIDFGDGPQLVSDGCSGAVARITRNGVSKWGRLVDRSQFTAVAVDDARVVVGGLCLDGTVANLPTQHTCTETDGLVVVLSK